MRVCGMVGSRMNNRGVMDYVTWAGLSAVAGLMILIIVFGGGALNPASREPKDALDLAAEVAIAINNANGLPSDSTQEVLVRIDLTGDTATITHQQQAIKVDIGGRTEQSMPAIRVSQPGSCSYRTVTCGGPGLKTIRIERDGLCTTIDGKEGNVVNGCD